MAAGTDLRPGFFNPDKIWLRSYEVRVTETFAAKIVSGKGEMV